MRLIDADELKKAIKETEYFNDYAFGFICDIIDNAPTEKLTFSLDNVSDEDIETFKLIWQRATSKGLLLVNENERPQGEWLKSDIPESILAKCSICGFDCGAHTYNYCPNCGAQMGGIENAKT